MLTVCGRNIPTRLQDQHTTVHMVFWMVLDVSFGWLPRRPRNMRGNGVGVSGEGGVLPWELYYLLRDRTFLSERQNGFAFFPEAGLGYKGRRGVVGDWHERKGGGERGGEQRVVVGVTFFLFFS